MATNYPTWGTYDQHGQPMSGYYWGDDSVGPRIEEGGEWQIFNQGPQIVIQKKPEIGALPKRQITAPRTSYFWWSSDMPSVEWWGERSAARRREIADRDELIAIEAGPAVTRELPSAPPFYKRDAPRLYDRYRSEDSRAHITARRETMPVNHNFFRHPLQGKPKGQESEYSWLLQPQLHARACGGGDSVIACSWHYDRSAMLRIEAVEITGGPTVHVITVNGQIFQWEMDQRFIMHIITSAQGVRGRREVAVFKEDAGAQPAPGQAEDNLVIKLDCGHVLDLPFEPGSQTQFYCAPCGGYRVRVFPPPVGYPYSDAPVEYPNRLSCGHTRMLNARYESGKEVRCFDCLPGPGVLRTVIL